MRMCQRMIYTWTRLAAPWKPNSRILSITANSNVATNQSQLQVNAYSRSIWSAGKRAKGRLWFVLSLCLVIKIATFLWSVENWSCKEFVYLHLNTSIIFADRLWETLASLSQRVYCTCQRQVVPWLQLWGKTKPDSSSLSIYFKI